MEGSRSELNVERQGNEEPDGQNTNRQVSFISFYTMKTSHACCFSAVQIQSETTDTETQTHLTCVVFLMVQISYNKL